MMTIDFSMPCKASGRAISDVNRQRYGTTVLMTGLKPGELLYHVHPVGGMSFRQWLSSRRTRLGKDFRACSRDVSSVNGECRDGWVLRECDGVQKWYRYDGGKGREVSRSEVPKLPSGHWLIWV